MAYKCRAYPTEEQAALLSRTFGCIRVVWNQVLNWRTVRYRADGLKTNYAEADKRLTELKRQPEFAWLNEVSSVPLQQTLRHQYKAYVAFFNGVSRYPRYKNRSGKQAASFTRSGFRFTDGNLFLAKCNESLFYVWSWPDVDPASIDPSTVTVSRNPDGMWYVTFQLEVADSEPLAEAKSVVGIDLGITHFATTSDGEKIDNPRHLERKQKNLARYQRRMAKCQKGSANRQKAKAKVARAHGKVRRARETFLHRTSTELVRKHDVIVIEDLAAKNMVQNRSLARAISDVGWSQFRFMLAYKAERYGRQFVVINRYFPSSKTCSSCGHLLDKLSLNTRTWQCPSCGTRHDRDINAAKNILAEGLSVSACGGDVRHAGTTQVQSPVKQDPSRVTERILVIHVEE